MSTLYIDNLPSTRMSTVLKPLAAMGRYLEIQKGESCKLRLTVRDSDGEAYDLTGAFIRLTVKHHYWDADSEAVVMYITGDEEIVVTSATGGLAEILIPARIFTPLPAWLTGLVWDVQITKAGDVGSLGGWIDVVGMGEHIEEFVPNPPTL